MKSHGGEDDSTGLRTEHSLNHTAHAVRTADDVLEASPQQKQSVMMGSRPVPHHVFCTAISKPSHGDSRIRSRNYPPYFADHIHWMTSRWSPITFDCQTIAQSIRPIVTAATINARSNCDSLAGSPKSRNNFMICLSPRTLAGTDFNLVHAPKLRAPEGSPSRCTLRPLWQA